MPKCVIKGPKRKEVPIEVLDNGDGTYDCVFVPEDEGRHDVDVLLAVNLYPEVPSK